MTQLLSATEANLLTLESGHIADAAELDFIANEISSAVRAAQYSIDVPRKLRSDTFKVLMDNGYRVSFTMTERGLYTTISWG